MKIDINKKYRYRDGEPARILCVDGGGNQPVISLTTGGVLKRHEENGAYFSDGETNSMDLVEVREPREFEICVAPDGQTVWHSDQGDTEKLRRDYDSGEIIRVREIID